jgi:hypothetical protein
MASGSSLSPSLVRPQRPKQTARQRFGNIGDADLQPLHRRSGGVGMLSSRRKPGEPPSNPQLARAQPPQMRVSPTLSPSVLGSAERTTELDDDGDAFMLPRATGDAPAAAPRAGAGAGGSSRTQGNRASSPGLLPEGPVARVSAGSSDALLSEAASIGADESYASDERALNEFLRLHPMLSLEATNRQTLQLVSSMFEKASVQVADVPIIPFSYDASYLRPPNVRIGERPCACGDNCICLFMARIRHGSDTPLAFVGTEFLLPTERECFLAGNGLPPRRKKCLVCTRYFQTLLYIQARTDPNFKVSSAPLEMQVFGNVVAGSSNDNTDPADLDELGRTMGDMPMSASIVHARDGYRPEAMLYVDEEFATMSRASREGNSAALMWKPVVRFNSSHYRYVQGQDGPHLVQVGIGSDDPTGTGLGFSSFVQPPAGTVAPSAASGTLP